MKILSRFLLFSGLWLTLAVATHLPVARAQSKIDLALVNGRVWVGDSALFAEALAISGDRIVRVGTTLEVKQLADAQTQVIDLGGRLVTPGFNDAHI